MSYPKFIWMVVPKEEFNGCLDIRRYAFSHRQAVDQLKHLRKDYPWTYKDTAGKGLWTLFKLVKVNKRRTK